MSGLFDFGWKDFLEVGTLGLVSAGLSAASGISAKRSADQAAGERERIGRLNAQSILAEADEDTKRASIESNQIESQAQAITAASGIGGKSRESYLKALSTSNSNQVGWINKSANSRAKLARQGANASANNLRRTGTQALTGSLIQGFNTFRQTRPRG